MIEKILQLGKEAAIYGLSSIVGRFINFLLVPLYTNFLLPAEYGVIATLYSYLAFAFIVYGFGMEAAYMRYVSSLEIGDDKQNFSTPFFFLLGSSILLSLLISGGAAPIARVIELGAGQSLLVRYGAWILCLDTLAVIPYASLRMKNRAMAFALIRLANIILNVVFVVILVVVMGMRAEGVVIANLAASAGTFLLLLRFTIPHLTTRFSPQLFKALLKFGIPYIPAGLASIAMQVIDRPILLALTDEATVGVYQASYRLGIFMMLVVGMFDYAWRPFFLNHAKDPNAKEMFSRVFTYFCILALGLFLVVSMFVGDLVRIHVLGHYFFHPDYWGGLSVVPWVLLAYVFNGAYVNFIIGVYLEKKTKYLPYVTGAGALANVVVNLLLIPRFGMMGAAVATLVSYMVIAAGIYSVSQRLYRVMYEWGKLLRLGAVAAVLYVAFLLLDVGNATIAAISVKAGLTAVFVSMLFVTGIVDRSEVTQTLAVVRSALRRRANGAAMPPSGTSEPPSAD